MLHWWVIHLPNFFNHRSSDLVIKTTTGQEREHLDPVSFPIQTAIFPRLLNRCLVSEFILIDILQEDDAEVKRRNLTHERIAERMSEFREAGKRGLGEFISVPPHFEVRVDSVRGKLPCPFKHPGLLRKTNIIVRNLQNDREITYTDMHIHMIGEHGFYEGRGSNFRLEVKDLVEILEISQPEE